MINIETKYANMNKLIKNEEIQNKNSTKDTKIKDTIENASTKDNINISDASKNMTTAQRAKKAFDDTFAEFKDFNTPEGDMSDFVREVIKIMEDLNKHPVPRDIISNPRSTETFSDFVDTMKSFAQNQHFIQLPKKFFEFCDKLKENFKLNGLR